MSPEEAPVDQYSERLVQMLKRQINMVCQPLQWNLLEKFAWSSSLVISEEELWEWYWKYSVLALDVLEGSAPK